MDKRKGFKSPYKTLYEKDWNLLHTGYDYENNLFKITTSPYLHRNKTTAEFIEHLNKIYVYMINSVKHIRIYFNYAVPKDYKKIN